MNKFLMTAFALATVLGAAAQAPAAKVLPEGRWVLAEMNDLEGYTVAPANRGAGLPMAIPELQVHGTQVDLVAPGKTWKGSWTVQKDSLYIEPGEGMPRRSFGIQSIGPKELRLRIFQKEVLELIYRREDAVPSGK